MLVNPVLMFSVSTMGLLLAVIFCVLRIPLGARICTFLVLPVSIALAVCDWRISSWMLWILVPTWGILLCGWGRVHTTQPYNAPFSFAGRCAQWGFGTALGIAFVAILIWRGNLKISHDLKDFAGIAWLILVFCNVFALFLPLRARQEGEVRARLMHYRIVRVTLGYSWNGFSVAERQIIFADEAGRTWTWRCSARDLPRYIGRIGSVYTFMPCRGLGGFLFLRHRPQLVERHEDRYAEPDGGMPSMFSPGYLTQSWKLIALVFCVTAIAVPVVLGIIIFLLHIIDK